MNTDLLKNKKCFVLDMDGTFYLGDTLLEGSLAFIESLTPSGRDFLFFTNNSSKSPKVYVEKLKHMGLFLPKEKVISSGLVTINYLKKTYGNPRVYLVGTPMLEEEFHKRGIHLTEDRPDVVVVGFDTTLTYDKLTRACTFIRQGVPFVATHLDLNCPTENGPIPDCGAMCALITASTGVKPVYLGKPFTATLDYILDYLHLDKEDIVFVGDRLYTDIAIGFRHQVTTVLVLTGETQLEDLTASEIKPDLVVNRLADLIPML